MGNFKSELKGYGVIPRDLVFDNSLSDRAKFVFVFMACKPNNWEFFLDPMANEIGYSVETLRKYIKELVDGGWLIKGKQNNENGKFGATEYTLKANKVLPYTENAESGKYRVEKNTIQQNNDIIHKQDIDTNINKEEDTNVSPKKNDYHAIVDCWNEYNGKKLGKVTKITDKRKKAIKKALVDNGITQEEMMTFFKTLPYADKWLYNPNKQHANWKPDFDWWMANTNGWFTKALEGKVHIENPQAYSSIMGGDDAPYTPICEGALSWNDYYSSFIFVGYWDGVHIPDGYTDETRPNGATIMLNNGRGNITWNKNTKQWEKV